MRVTRRAWLALHEERAWRAGDGDGVPGVERRCRVRVRGRGRGRGRGRLRLRVGWAEGWMHRVVVYGAHELLLILTTTTTTNYYY